MGGAQIGKVIQGYINVKGEYQTYIEGRNSSELFEEVAAVDGLFMCIPKKLFDMKMLWWDSETFNGFHCYDMDICYQVLINNFRIFVLQSISIEHFSSGNTDSIYCSQSQLLYNKWHEFLPIIRGREMSEKEIYERTKMVDVMRTNLLLFNKVQDKYDGIRMSKAYRLGRYILRPLKLLQKR